MPVQGCTLPLPFTVKNKCTHKLFESFYRFRAKASRVTEQNTIFRSELQRRGKFLATDFGLAPVRVKKLVGQLGHGSSPPMSGVCHAIRKLSADT